MKKFLKELKEDKIIHYILIVMASAIAIIPLIKIQLYGTDDGFIHILRTAGVHSILKLGQFPPFIYANYCNGFGYAINLFYNPIVTYLPIIFKIFTNTYYNSLKIYTYFTIVISGITMYKLAYQVSKKREIAIIAAIIYIFIPYRLETIYNRFAIGEFSAYMFIPLVFLGLYNLLNEDGKKHYYIAIGATCLILTHTITTEYTAAFCLLYLILNIKKLKDINILKKIGINILFIVCMTLFFTMPIFEHKLLGNYTILSAQSMGTNGEYAYSYAIRLHQLFHDIGEVNGVSFTIGIPFLFLMLIGIFTYKKMDQSYKKIYLSLLLIAIISLWMSTKYFPWMIMPNFVCTLQFPWRMLMFFEFAMSIISAINLYTLILIISKNKKAGTEAMLLLVSIILIILTMQKLNYKFEVDGEKNLSDAEFEKMRLAQTTVSHWNLNREYLPINCAKNEYQYLDIREDRVYLISGQAEILEENKNNLTLDFKIKNAKKDTILELPYIYYLGYEVKIENSKEALKTFETENGFVGIQLPSDITEAQVHVEYTGTVVEKVAYTISLITFIIFIAYITNTRKKRNTQ